MVHFKQNVVPLQPQNQTVTNYGTIRSFEKRRTIRDFTGEIVSDELLAKVLNTALYAPTNDHLRQFEFVVVKGGENIARLVADFDKNYNLVLDGIHEEAAKGNIDKDKYDMFLHTVPRQKRMLIESGCVVIPYFKQNGSPLLKPEKLHSLGCSLEK